MKRLAVPAILIVLLARGDALARGGGGCVESGMPVLTPSGWTAVERLVAGDAVVTVSDGRVATGRVVSCVAVEPAEFVELVVGGRTLRLTGEHPVAVAPGVYRMASRLNAGDAVAILEDGEMRSARLSSVRPVSATAGAHNLIVSPGGAFVASGVVLHNKGCFLPDTPVLREDGSAVAIRDVKPGDRLLAFTPDEAVTAAAVRDVLALMADGYVIVATDRRELRATPEHPFYAGEGTFRTVEALTVGDSVFVLEGRELVRETIVRIERVRATTRVYNLQTDNPHTYFASGVAVHNKGGCFPSGTAVLTPGGERPIETLRPGDGVLAIDSAGRIVRASVERVMQTRSEIFLVETASRLLRTTVEHPLRLADGAFRPAGELLPGECVATRRDGRAAAEPVLATWQLSEPAAVFNLTVGEPHTFFADGFAVHNKGGCFPTGTAVLTPAGERAIERLVPGDAVMAVDARGRIVASSVEATGATRSAVLVVETDLGALRTTPEHPVRMVDGGFREAGRLAPGDLISALGVGSAVAPATVRSTRLLAGEEDVHNLTVSAPHTFVASGFAVHNKGGFGCFPAGTRVRTPRGESPIETLLPGDAVIARDGGGRAVETSVEATSVARGAALVIDTDLGTLRATGEHPLMLPGGGFREAGDLAPGDLVLALRGGRLLPATVRSVQPVGAEGIVYNLTVGAPHTFVADGFVVHNKGGFHSHGGGGGGGSPPVMLIIIVVIIVVIVIAVKIGQSGGESGVHFLRSSRAENLDYVFTRFEIEDKAAKTDALLAFIAKQDPVFAKESLVETARATFLKLQECWQARDYAPMEPLMMGDLWSEHVAQLNGMIETHEINRMDDLQVEAIDIANVRYTETPDEREFTALFSARVRDYYVDDTTGEFLRGDPAPEVFQEFWTFQLQQGKWLLRQIEQTGESDVLHDENFFEPMTEETLQEIYAGTAAQGEAGPWVEKETVEKATKIERMLNFLVQTDKIWDRQEMIDRSRSVFLRVMLARQAGEADAVPADALFPGVAASLVEEIRRRQSSLLAMEFRNLCVRKVEIVLVRNFEDRSQDEFTARITAHAQIIVRRAGFEILKQPDVEAFEEYWTFGRLDNVFKLKEVQPPAEGLRMIRAENLDQESTPSQLEWYYQQPRAN